MKKLFWVLVMCLTLLVGNAEAARRFGSGRSIGQQSGNVAQRRATPVAPAQGAPDSVVRPASPTTPGMAAPAPRRPWGAMLGGVAAGLGLAWLASSLGLGAAMGQFMVFALLALVIMMAVGWWMRRRKSSRQNTPPFAFQSAVGVAAGPVDYRSENVGNDASARPWERNATLFHGTGAGSAASGSLIGSGQTWWIPVGFDSEEFLKSAKANFVSLQAAWDRSDMAALRVMMTDTMIKEIQSQLAEREVKVGGTMNLTEVVVLEAHLLGIEDRGDDYMASVEFSGLIREEPSADPGPFREVWNMIKSKSGASGWLVAGVQSLQ